MDNGIDKKSSVVGTVYTLNNVTADHAIAATFSLAQSSSVNGSCGTSNGGVFTSAPAVNLCSAGTESSVSGSGPWSWTCAGANGGTTSTCSASLQTTNSLTTLFQDNFNDNVIDTTKWITTRADVRIAEETGIMKIEQNQTDVGVYLKTVSIPVAKDLPFSIKRKVLLHSNKVSSAEYTYHGMSISLDNGAANPVGVFGISYLNTTYYDGDYQTAALNGIYTTSATGVRTKLNAPIWDIWFDEEVQYDPVSGQLVYKINNATVNTVNVGVLPSAATSDIIIGFSPYGWWTGHYQHVDDIIVSQSSATVTPVTTGACGTSNNQSFSSVPATNLCSTGTATTISGTGPWYWSCAGTNGGATASCAAYSGTPTTTNATKAKIYLGLDDSFTISNSGATVYGSAGNDTVTIASGTSNVTLDQNVDRINFASSSSSYQFKQTGNKINVYNVTGTTLLVTVPVQGDTDGTVLGFSDGYASAKLTAGVMILGGATVSTSAPGALTPKLQQ